jgi:C1A family cysteine protease
MKAMRLFGVPPERYWPYDPGKFDDEPTAFCYAYGQNYQAIKYYRLDPVGTSRQELLARVKEFIDKNLPSMFGFTVYSSINAARESGEIPFPNENENVTGGHAVVAMGYDDNKEIQNTGPHSKPTVGALQIRNSWGTNWGDGGYGWLPYEYVLQGMAIDWWSLIKNEWVDSGQFS